MNVLALLLTLAAAVSSVLLVVSTVRAGHRRTAPSDLVLHDLYEAAFLSGGPPRVVDTALTGLQADGRVAVGGPGIVVVLRAEARDPVERAVFEEAARLPAGSLSALRAAVMTHPAVQEIGDGLAARGLMLAPRDRRPRRRWAIVQTVCCFALFPLSMLLTFVEYAAIDGYGDMPLPFVVKMLPTVFVGGLLGIVVAAGSKSRVTKAGRAAIVGFRTAFAHVTTPQHLVAVLGLGALPDPELRAQLLAAARVRRTPRGAYVSAGSSPAAVPVVWCAGVGPGGSSCGSGNGGSGCGSGSGCSSGSSCSSGSGCGSGSSGSSCGGSSGGGGSSCGGGGGSSCGGGGS
ncbi:TIGR04222 domain-containing membrane protein [uncultured Streptomyces sp.]|uniref:TIGR04222 domain-containing membrane protein n=1 Tax=uncultured Streptomyces sp. TaxID=174707 RepID=UPI00261A31CB|nr:TIGR04222 domain-containing membrane protein [uncultured Streptomyces sp.]